MFNVYAIAVKKIKINEVFGPILMMIFIIM